MWKTSSMINWMDWAEWSRGTSSLSVRQAAITCWFKGLGREMESNILKKMDIPMCVNKNLFCFLYFSDEYKKNRYNCHLLHGKSENIFEKCNLLEIYVRFFADFLWLNPCFPLVHSFGKLYGDPLTIYWITLKYERNHF